MKNPVWMSRTETITNWHGRRVVLMKRNEKICYQLVVFLISMSVRLPSTTISPPSILTVKTTHLFSNRFIHFRQKIRRRQCLNLTRLHCTLSPHPSPSAVGQCSMGTDYNSFCSLKSECRECKRYYVFGRTLLRGLVGIGNNVCELK
jgi:hypothetical protein